MRIGNKKNKINSIDLATEANRISLKRDEQKEWQVFSETESMDGDSTAIQELLTTLSEIKAEKFVRDAPSEKDLSSYGLPLDEELEDYLKQPKRLTITLGMQSGEQRVLLLGKPIDEEEIFAKCRKEAFVYTISNELPNKVPLNALHYRTRFLNPLAKGANIKEIILRDMENNATLTGQEDNATLEMTTKLSELIRKFEIEKYVPGPFTESELAFNNDRFPWRFKLTVEIVLAGGDSEVTEKRTYFFSKKTGSTQYGGSPNFNLLFKLEQQMMDAIDVLVSTRSPPPETDP